MSISSTRIDELIAITRHAFGTIPRPVCTKRIARALDDEWLVPEERGNELSAVDTERNWWDVSDEEILEFSAILPWLSPEGFGFYYPAFLSYTLRHWNETHDRVHLETFDAIGLQPQALDMLTLEELNAIDEILTELTCDPQGADYEWVATLTAIEKQIRRKT